MSYVFLVVGLGLVGVWMWRRRRPTKARKTDLASYVLLFDENREVLHKVEYTEGGSFLIDGAEYPPALARRVELAADIPMVLYTIGIESTALHQHRELERVRFGILTGNIFKPAGDMVETLRLVGAAVIIGVAVFVYSQVAAISSAQAQNYALLEQVKAKLEQPLVVKGGDSGK